MTRWAAQVSATNAHPEYPRPQLVRTEWLNLNGLWDYAITAAHAQVPSVFDGKILVPFPLESSLSGVGLRLDEKSTLWYRCRFSLPDEWEGKHIRLHFGAVDWETSVLVNGHAVGSHRGGYDPFTFDLTEFLNGSETQELVVAVTDPTEGDQPRGKQSRKPEGIFYTPSSGIWQTAWLEPVSETCIDSVRLMADPALSQERLRVNVNHISDTLQVEAVALADGREVGRVVGPAGSELRVPLSEAHLWSPNSPFLYDLQITLRDGSNVVDRVTSYFGLRSIGLKRDAKGVMRIALNDEFIFQVGALDQGYWPDGIYTAPTDDATRAEIEFLKEAGFNLARKHVKVEPERWYYWCDKLGLLVWQDFPSGKNRTPEGRHEFESEMQRLVAGLRDHPSIVMWVLFNESWGQYDTERLTQWLKILDDSRLIDNASGWTDAGAGDVVDTHNYPWLKASPGGDRAAVIGEFGGLGLGVEGHTWAKQFWGYQKLSDASALTSQYIIMMRTAQRLRESAGLSAIVYTQTSDVERLDHL